MRSLMVIPIPAIQRVNVALFGCKKNAGHRQDFKEQ